MNHEKLNTFKAYKAPRNLFSSLPASLSSILEKAVKTANLTPNNINEIRLRIGENLVLVTGNKSLRINFKITTDYLNELVNYFTGYSFYAFENQLRAGFLALPGGHRVGICGSCNVENGILKSMDSISSINIRHAKEYINSASTIVPHIFSENSICNTLLISPPAGGKTTILRDLIRLLSNCGLNAGVIDERLEISGKIENGFSFDIGKNTDVISNCNKIIGFRILLRGMSPDFIATDELSKDDFNLLEEAKAFGIPVIATIHGNALSNSSVYMKKYFSCFIYLSKIPVPGTIIKIEKIEKGGLL